MGRARDQPHRRLSCPCIDLDLKNHVGLRVGIQERDQDGSRRLRRLDHDRYFQRAVVSRQDARQALGGAVVLCFVKATLEKSVEGELLSQELIVFFFHNQEENGWTVKIKLQSCKSNKRPAATTRLP